MSNRGNLFANIENEFDFSGPDEIIQRTQEAFSDLTIALVNAKIDGPQGLRGTTLYPILLAAARYGTEGTTRLSDGEKRMVDAVFSIFNRATQNTVTMQQYYSELAQPIREDDQRIVRALARPGFAIPLLRLILGFAYADGKLSDEAGAELESIFGFCLIAEFAQSGQQSVPAPRVRVSPLENDIVSWFRSEDGVYTVSTICAHFPGRSRDEVQSALDALVQKGVIFACDTIMGKTYALE